MIKAFFEFCFNLIEALAEGFDDEDNWID